MLRPILCLIATAFTFTAHANALQGNPELAKSKVQVVSFATAQLA